MKKIINKIKFILIAFIMIALSITAPSCVASEDDTSNEQSSTTTNNSSTDTAATQNASSDETEKTNVIAELIVKNIDQQKVGKSEVVIDLSNLEASLIADAPISINPIMNMGDVKHNTPIPGPCTKGEDQLYRCTVFYIMASMGENLDWALELKQGDKLLAKTMIHVSGNTALDRILLKGVKDTFVMDSASDGMAMKETVVLNAQNQNLRAMEMEPSSGLPRPYFIFLDVIEQNSETSDGYRFSIFAAVRKSMMMHPALYQGLTLTDPKGESFNIETVRIELSLNPAVDDWQTLTEDPIRQGYYVLENISSLQTGLDTAFYLRLSVNGETKTKDGLTPEGENSYGMLTVRP